MRHHRLRGLLLLLLVSTLSGCASSTKSRAPESPASFVTEINTDVVDRLFFGRAIPTGGTVSDKQWSDFMREEVTPRFPEGLTFWQAEGQWLDPHGVLVHEPVMIVEIVHRPSPDFDAKVEAIALAYKRRFHQDAVLRVRTGADVRYFDQ